jgi:D-alanine-D-alanine ligase
MPARPLDILVVCDLGAPPPADQDYAERLKEDEYDTERSVLEALGRLGHAARLYGVFDDIHGLIEELRRRPPDLVFNLCEAFDRDRDKEPHLAGLFELMKVRYTGAPPAALRICKDKGLTKKILSYHRIPVPRFVVSHRARPLKRLRNFAFPAFIKPLGLEASEGIARMSFADTEKDSLDRVRFVHESLGVDAIVEEYIDGRELYVGLLGNHRVEVLPPRELFFAEIPEGEPRFATFKAKWDEAYRKRWGIDSGPAHEIPPAALRDLNDVCRKVYRLFGIEGYARIDLRLKPSGDIVFLEANPNPSLAPDEDFAQAARAAGIGYDDLIGRILRLAGA